MTRILIVKLSSFGDVIHTFPALTDLRAARPDIAIDWAVEEAFAPIAGLHPAVAEVHGIAWRRLRWPPTRWPAFASTLRGLRQRQRARRYDLVVDLQGLMKSALTARLAGAPVAGYDGGNAREPAAARFYTHRFAIPRDQHAVERTRQLLAAATGYAVPRTAGAFGLARPTPGAAGIELPPHYGVLVHSASWPTKLWDEERWRQLVRACEAAGKAVVLPWGNETEKARAERLAAGSPGAIVLPRLLNGTELAACIGGAEFAIGLDSGLMHLGAAFDVPGVWLYGPTNPAKTGPYGSQQAVVHSTHAEAPCLRRTCDREPGGRCCMDRIAFDRVWNEVAAVLARGQPGSA